MKLDLKDSLHLPDGTYETVVTESRKAGDKILVIFQLKAEDRLFKKFFKKEELEDGAMTHVFKQMDSTESDDLKGKEITITTRNNKSSTTGQTYSNIIKAWLTQDNSADD